MRKHGLLFLLILTFFVGVFSCSKDEFTDTDAINYLNELDSLDRIRDSLERIGGIVEYSVNVVEANGSAWVANKSGAKGIGGAVITVSQFGQAVTKVADESGIAVFSDMRIGTVNVSVKLEGYTEVNYVALLEPEDELDIDIWYGIERFAATMVPVFSLDGQFMSTIEGKVTYENDLTNFLPEVASGVDVIASIWVEHPDFKNTYLLPKTNDYDYTGIIQQISFGNMGFMGTTDEDGLYSINVPSTTNGLPYRIEVSDFTADQQLLLRELNGMNVLYEGIQTVRTVFSSNPNLTLSIVPNKTQTRAAYITFSDPTGDANLGPDEKATAAANITESGIVSINIANKGEGYTQTPVVIIDEPHNIHYGIRAEAEAAITDGKVTAVNITNPGKGYQPNQNVNVQFIDKLGENAEATPYFTYSIHKIDVNVGNMGYEARPNVTIHSGSGTGASAEAVMAGYVYEVEVTDMGSGYNVAPDVVITNSPTNQNAIATAVMSENNPIHSIILSNNYLENNFFEVAPRVEILPGNEGSGATAVVELSNAGVVGEIQVINGGTGYTEAPTVTILGGGGTGATAYATIDADGSVNAIMVNTKGQGFTSDPTILLSAPPAGGVQATAEATRHFQIAGITVTNPGNGYDFRVPTDANVPVVNFYDGVDNTNLGLNQANVTVYPSMKVESINVGGLNYGYTSTPTVTILPKNMYGGGAKATATLLWSVDEIKMVEVGQGYQWDDGVVVQIDPPTHHTGVAATGTVSKGHGIVDRIELTKGGEGYTAPPNVLIHRIGTPVGIEVKATVSGGAVTGFNIIDNSLDDGYDDLGPAAFSFTISTKTHGAAANAQANPESGKIQFVDVTNPGAGYEIAPTVRFVRVDNLGNPVDNQDNSNFVNAEAIAHLVDGRVASIEVVNPGTGYYYEPTVELISQDYVEVATADVTVDNEGRITGIANLQGGLGYIEAPTVTFEPSVPGLGSGATAVAHIQDGQVTGITMTNRGTGYIGQNRPNNAIPFSMKPGYPDLETISGISYVKVINGRSFVFDMYMGTGERTIDSN